MSEFKLLKNCDILTPLRVIRNGSVLIKGKSIQKVGQFGDSRIPPGTRVFNFKNRLAVPGFIDIHLHGAAGVDFTDSSPESIVTALKTHSSDLTWKAPIFQRKREACSAPSISEDHPWRR
jgi:N-acetylglucosamine-6-phosphate deacetylase